jgi:hypothetical protein
MSASSPLVAGVVGPRITLGHASKDTPSILPARAYFCTRKRRSALEGDSYERGGSSYPPRPAVS